MHDELAQRRRPLVAAPPVHHEQPADVRELRDGEVCRQRRRLPLLRARARAVCTWGPRPATRRL